MIELWRHHRTVGNILVGLLVGVFLVLLLAAVQRTGETAAAIRAQQVKNQAILRHTRHAARDAATSARLIESCVNPGGSCYERGQRQTGDAVGKLNQYILLSASCTAHIATATHGLVGISQTDLTKLITACVRSQLTVQQQRR